LKHVEHTILLVEDDPDDVMLISEALKSAPSSLTIINKKNGLEALNYLHERKSKNELLPCLIIIDINMPVLNGKQLLAILKNDEDFKFIPLIVFTTSSTDGDKEFCNGFNVPMVTKPNGMDAFNGAVQKFLDHCQAA
jgi:CheY-like chemotaxis protein